MITEMNIHCGHIYLLIQLPPKEVVTYAMQIMKGCTSKKIRKEFLEHEELLRSDKLWAEGYFAESVGQVAEFVI